MEKKQPFVYEGSIASAGLDGEGRFCVEEEGLVCNTDLDSMTVAFSEMVELGFGQHTVRLRTDRGDISLSRMGQSGEWLYQELLAAYHKKVLAILKIEGAADLACQGNYSHAGKGGEGKIQIFSDCLCLLTPDRQARRLPYVFVKGIKKENYALTISLVTGENYTFSMLGYDLEPMERKISRNIRKQREKNRDFIGKIAALGFGEGDGAAKQMPEGTAAFLHLLPEKLKEALEKKAGNSRLGSFYDRLGEVGDVSRLAVGIRELPEAETELLKTALSEKQSGNPEGAAGLTPEQEDSLKWDMWFVFPSRDGKKAIVEFALPGEDAATYIFRAEGSFEEFLLLINRGLEATDLQREIFSLTDRELQSGKYADERMLAERTPAIERLRKLYMGKAIHRSVEAWKRSVLSLTGE